MTRTRIMRVLPFLPACAVPAAAQARAVAVHMPAGEQVPPAVHADSATPQEPPGEEAMPPAATPLPRDVFTYVAAGRRDPFVPALPLPPDAASAPLEAELLGIIGHADPVRSVVVVRVGHPAPVGGGPPPDSGRVVDGIHRLRLGDRIGSLQVLSIHEHQVIVEVAGPAGVERRLLTLPRPPGGAR